MRSRLADVLSFELQSIASVSERSRLGVASEKQHGPLDFCILGAPASGKTALVAYLRTHPQVFITDIEPNFYADDIDYYHGPTPLPENQPAYCEFFAGAADGYTPRPENRKAYCEFFAGATDQLLGEVSGLYLYSERAVPNILKDSPHARFIVFLRNPVDIASALHSNYLRNLYEDESSFQKAWELQDARAAGQRIPPLCPEPKILLYRQRSSFAGHLERFFQRVPRERVLVHVFEEFFADPKAGYARTLAFLGLPDDGRRHFERINEHAVLRSRLLQRLAVYPPFPFNRLSGPLKRVFNAIGLYPRSAFHRWNRGIHRGKKERTNGAPMDPSFRRQLEAEFRPEVARLAAILGRNLDVWRSD